jgi:hypothetical protein
MEYRCRTHTAPCGSRKAFRSCTFYAQLKFRCVWGLKYLTDAGVKERFGGHKLIDVDQVCKNIELTRFPVPQDEDHKDTTGFVSIVTLRFRMSSERC